jgi:AraC family transcriptional regulator, ethanolamine operon transcriptional activator
METPDPVTRPAVEVVEFTDPTIANAGIELIEQDAVQLESMPLRVRRIIVRLADAAVVFHAANRRVRSATSARAGLLAYVVFGPQVHGTVNGLPVRDGLMLAAAPEAAARFVTEPGWQSITVMLRPQLLEAHLLARHRVGEFHAPRGVEALSVSGAQVGELLDWGKRLVDTAARQPALFDERADVRMAVRVELVETLIATLRRADDVEVTRSDRKRQAYSAMIKAVEDYALAHVGDHLYVTDLCKVAATSERTLEYAFKEVMGISPIAYLMRLRLHRARQAMLAGSQGSTTVSAEALNWGFWHFGEFSRAYKECFGELPSDTLRRRPDDPQQLPVAHSPDARAAMRQNF